MSGLGNTYELPLLDAVLGSNHGAAFPNTVYMALFTATPTGAGGGTEVATGSYTRIAVVNDSTNFANATSVSGVGTKTNATQILFPQATASWGTVSHWAFFDASTGGAIVVFGKFLTPTAIVAGDTPVVGAGVLQIRAVDVADA